MFGNLQHHPTPPAARRGISANLPEAVRLMIRTATSRRRLRNQPRMLADIGITRVEALTEAARAPWRNGLHLSVGFSIGLAWGWVSV